MQYCKNCRVLCDTQCPFCGNRKLCDPQPEDQVRVTTAAGFRADMLEGLLDDNHIPYEKHQAVQSDEQGQAFHYYVPYQYYTRAEELCAVAQPPKEETQEQSPQEPSEEEAPRTYTVKGETFEEMPHNKKIFWRIVSVLLFLAVIAVVVLLTDQAANWVKGLFA